MNQYNSFLGKRVMKLSDDVSEALTSDSTSDIFLQNKITEIALYCFENIEIPEGHINYVFKNIFVSQNDVVKNKVNIIEYFKTKRYLDNHKRSPDLIFRSISAMISYTETDLDFLVYEKVNDLIDSFYIVEKEHTPL